MPPKAATGPCVRSLFVDLKVHDYDSFVDLKVHDYDLFVDLKVHDYGCTTPAVSVVLFSMELHGPPW